MKKPFNLSQYLLRQALAKQELDERVAAIVAKYKPERNRP